MVRDDMKEGLEPFSDPLMDDHLVKMIEYANNEQPEVSGGQEVEVGLTLYVSRKL